MKGKHKLGDYLYKNGKIYTLVSHWENNFVSEFYSIFLEETTGKMFCSPFWQLIFVIYVNCIG